MEEVIGFKDSPYAGGTMEHLPLDKMSIVLAEGKEPGMTGAVEFTSPIGTKIVFRKYRKGESLFMDGYYRLEDIIGRFDNTITEFENLAKEYGVSD